MGGWAIAVHGGAGVDPNLPNERQEEAKQLLTRCLNLGISALRSSLSAIDVVELVVRELESDPLFNSGRGSALTEKGTVEMEASIMDGPGRRCGAVSGVTTVRNPISLARLVMDKSPHSYLAFSGAEEFAKQHGVEMVDNDFFITEDNIGMLKLAKEANSILDSNIRAGILRCSGGEADPNERPPNQRIRTGDSWMRGGRQPRPLRRRHLDRWTDEQNGRSDWDSPLIGAARTPATCVGFRARAREAVDYVIKRRLDDGKAGLIAVSSKGEVAYGFNSVGMFRGCATEDGFMEVGIWE
ncbi:hypothetical protein DH2020_035371 [Rehmannia glutinosa]|uniref:L-asparaginase n=1 Tax=Rehmannia glutinosa TaxID=99300 RepID=A0ABR0V7E7_REHGL